MTKKNEVSKVENLPSYMKSGSFRGQENVTVDDLSIPRLDVIQSLSPRRKKSDPAYIEGAEEGTLFNSVTNELYGTSVTFVPVFFRKEYVIWKDRSAGGGFAGAFKSRAEAEVAIRSLSEAHTIEDTAQHFGMVIDGDTVIAEVVVSMSRSKLKASRQLNTLCKMVGGDRFSSSYKLAAVEVSGDKGNYYNLSVSRIGYVSEDVFRLAEKLYEAISSGDRDVSRGTEEEKDDVSAPY